MKIKSFPVRVVEAEVEVVVDCPTCGKELKRVHITNNPQALDWNLKPDEELDGSEYVCCERCNRRGWLCYNFPKQSAVATAYQLTMEGVE